MRILITNDDGVFSEGLWELAEALGLTNGRITPMNYLSAARALKMDYRALSRALGVEPHFNPTRRGRGPGQRARGPRQRP